MIRNSSLKAGLTKAEKTLGVFIKRDLFGKFKSKITNDDDFKQRWEQYLNKRKGGYPICLCQSQMWTTFGEDVETKS